MVVVGIVSLREIDHRQVLKVLHHHIQMVTLRVQGEVQLEAAFEVPAVVKIFAELQVHEALGVYEEVAAFETSEEVAAFETGVVLLVGMMQMLSERARLVANGSA